MLLHEAHAMQIVTIDAVAYVNLAATHEALGQTAQTFVAYLQALQHDANLQVVQAKIDAFLAVGRKAVRAVRTAGIVGVAVAMVAAQAVMQALAELFRLFPTPSALLRLIWMAPHADHHGPG